MLFVGCDKNREKEIEENQVLFFYAYYGDLYWDRDSNIFVETESTSGWGVLLTDSTPTFDYFKMGSESFSDSGYVKFYDGYISFGDYDFDGNAIITSDLNPLNIEVKTSLGTISGSINFPDEIESITLSQSDTLEIGEPLTISWTGSNANFYNVSYSYRWKDKNGKLGTTYFNEFTSDILMTLPGSLFDNDGEIIFLYVIPQNGPSPTDNEIGNMSGDGSGFLYYSIDGTRYNGENIVVGLGTGTGNLSQSSFEILAKEQLDKNREMLEKKIRETRGKNKE